MERVLPLLATVAALSFAAPQGAWAHSPLRSSQGDRAITHNLPHPAEQARPDTSEHDRNDLRHYRLFYRERLFWYAGAYEPGPDCALHPSQASPHTMCG